jgi:hypothetical protein
VERCEDAQLGHRQALALRDLVRRRTVPARAGFVTGQVLYVCGGASVGTLAI